MKRFPAKRIALLAFCWLFCSFTGQALPTNAPLALDFRYAPTHWQTSICLPDDWQKTLVGKDGSLLYDYPGIYSDFVTRITPGVVEGAQWERQELESSRAPIVRTTRRIGAVEITEEAFTITPPSDQAAPGGGEFEIQRIGQLTGQVGWASPPAGTDPAFRNVALGWTSPLQYSFKSTHKGPYTVVFGICEGHHDQPGKRVLELRVEGKTRRVVDPIAERGKNKPGLYSFQVEDENGDGWIDLAVIAAANSSDRNSILNVLWVFDGTEIPSSEELLAGRSNKKPLAHLDCGAGVTAYSFSPRHDMLLVHFKNSGSTPAALAPTLTIDSVFAIQPDRDRRHIAVGDATKLVCVEPFERAEKTATGLKVYFKAVSVPPHGERVRAFCVARGLGAPDLLKETKQARSLQREAEKYWRKVNLPYDRFVVPDKGVQDLLDSCVRNIYQAREIKKGLPAFQVGPAGYRGLWVVDGSFIMEAVTYLGRGEEARNGVKYLLSFQRPDGSFMLLDGHWKETGIVLWAVCRHAQLTGDREWLRSVWPNVRRAFAAIRAMRGMAAAGSPNARLIPDGFSDGGLADQVPEYTNIYWTMNGMRAAIAAASWLGEEAEASDWQKEYDDFYRTFRCAAQRDMRADAFGNRYLPIRMTHNENILPQKAQWAFLHSIFPGRVFEAGDPLVQGNMAMLKAVECEGLVRDTGWVDKGLWNYFGSFYGHAWLWLGDGQKAAQTLYAFGNHASPLLVWREEQMPVGEGSGCCGDMPHNWASAEFIRLVRHSLVLERGTELHLFEGMPAEWAKPGAALKLREVPTEFGPVSLEFHTAKDGRKGTLKLTPPRRNKPDKIVLHLDNWSGKKGVIELPTEGRSKKTIELCR